MKQNLEEQNGGVTLDINAKGDFVLKTKNMKQ